VKAPFTTSGAAFVLASRALVMSAVEPYVVVGVFEDGEFVPFHRTRDPDLLQQTARIILSERRAAIRGGVVRRRVLMEEYERLRELFGEFGIPMDTDEEGRVRV